MKRLILAAAAIATLAPAAAMAASNGALSPADELEIRRYVPGADLDGLTPEQVRALVATLYHGDGDTTGYEIRSILAN